MAGDQMKLADFNHETDCGVYAEDFPRLKFCCERTDLLCGGSFQVRCPNCTVWRSPPDGDSLMVTHIIECSKYGFFKRIKE